MAQGMGIAAILDRKKGTLANAGAPPPSDNIRRRQRTVGDSSYVHQESTLVSIYPSFHQPRLISPSTHGETGYYSLYHPDMIPTFQVHSAAARLRVRYRCEKSNYHKYNVHSGERQTGMLRMNSRYRSKQNERLATWS